MIIKSMSTCQAAKFVRKILCASLKKVTTEKICTWKKPLNLLNALVSYPLSTPNMVKKHIKQPKQSVSCKNEALCFYVISVNIYEKAGEILMN